MRTYKDTVFLPQTTFAMRANLPQKEPEILAKWTADGLDKKLYDKNKGGDKTFILHDGPPYANGNIHIGHALNKILKDVINRSYRMMGYHVPYIPGWDCHGLPIEWKIEEEYRQKNKSFRKEDIDQQKFRHDCREYAAKWVEIQKNEFKRLGITGDWEHPYITMDAKIEASIVTIFHEMVDKGYVYAAKKPVLWSVVEETALAEAEVEYIDKTSTEVYVKFPIKDAENKDISGDIVIWTTTPWTLPANAAVAYNPTMEYVRLDDGKYRLVVAKNAVPRLKTIVVFSDDLIETSIDSKALQGIKLERPFNPKVVQNSWDKANGDFVHDDENVVRLYPADFVTDDTGSGFVHIAPAHGEDDFELYKNTIGAISCHHISYDRALGNFPDIIDGKGWYNSYAPDAVQGLHIFKAEASILKHLGDKLLYQHPYQHAYPHSWRSKKPLIYRTTRQFFINVDNMRDEALRALDTVAFYPPQGQRRLSSMIQQRGDWCVSRQRLWGVPLSVLMPFVGSHHKMPTLPDKTFYALLQNEGLEAWHMASHAGIVPKNDTTLYDKINDVLDVWFDSGATWRAVLQERGLGDRANLYVEGSDQHRGWFQSSLLESIAVTGNAPYKAILTHGFVLDEQGRKMSKSLGNVVSPDAVIQAYGADILRWWVMTTDYYDDVRISNNILSHVAEQYRKIRNTLRYILGALHGSADTTSTTIEDGAYQALPDIEKVVLHQVYTLHQYYQDCAKDYSFNKFYTALYQFITADLSAKILYIVMGQIT
jgi:isoleucyl-tRNA synthetase